MQRTEQTHAINLTLIKILSLHVSKESEQNIKRCFKKLTINTDKLLN